MGAHFLEQLGTGVDCDYRRKAKLCKGYCLKARSASQVYREGTLWLVCERPQRSREE